MKRIAFALLFVVFAGGSVLAQSADSGKQQASPQELERFLGLRAYDLLMRAKMKTASVDYVSDEEQGRQCYDETIGSKDMGLLVAEGPAYLYAARFSRALIDSVDRQSLSGKTDAIILLGIFGKTVNDEPQAFSCPGGLIAIEEKILAYAENEVPFAFVAAHELGHSVLRHDAERTLIVEFVNRALPSLYQRQTIRCEPDDAGCLAVIKKMDSLEEEVRELQEEEADQWALRLITKMGYKGDDAFAYLNLLSSYYGNRVNELRAWSKREHIDLTAGEAFVVAKPDVFTELHRQFAKKYPHIVKQRSPFGRN